MPYDIFHKYNFDNPSEEQSEWKFVKSKEVTDSDGFKTEYSWYTNGTKHIFMFGDSDLYEPDEAYADWECETHASAQEWFDNYNGFDEDDEEDDIDDLYECSSSKTAFDVIDKGLKNHYRPESLNEDFNNLPQWLIDYLGKNTRLKQELTKRGIDLQNATYIKAPLPRSNRDPVLRDPTRLNIFKIVDFGGRDHIYIYGVTDPEIRVSPWDWRSASNISMKKLLEYTEEYGYIDLNDARNSNKDLRKERADLKHSLTNVRGKGQYPVSRNIYNDNSEVIGSEIKWITARGEDKSGYKLNPSKYVDMLNDVGLDTYGVRLQSYYSRIESFRNELIQLVSTFDLKNASKYKVRDAFRDNVYGQISYAFGLFSDAIDKYQYLNKEVNNIIAVTDHNDEVKERRIKYLFEYAGVSLHKCLKDLRTSIDQIKNAELLDEE